MTRIPDPRGVLHPARLPAFARLAPGPELQELVAWFWRVDWDLAAGRTLRQELLPFPLLNLVVQPRSVTLCGPATGSSHKDLSGRGWAVAALLRPAASSAFDVRPALLLDREVEFAAPGLLEAVRAAKQLRKPAGDSPADCVQAFSAWLAGQLPKPSAAGLAANGMLDAVANDPQILRVSQLAAQLGLSVRSLQRLSERHLGIPPLAVIRRYRLQEAARQLRDQPRASVAAVAAQLGYSDQAHLAADFRRVVGSSPISYRQH